MQKSKPVKIKKMPSKKILEAYIWGLVNGQMLVSFDLNKGEFIPHHKLEENND